MSDQICEFCGAAFQWTPEQVALNTHLLLFARHCTGLGACCPDCDEKQVQLAIKQDRLDRRRDRDRERRGRLSRV